MRLAGHSCPAKSRSACPSFAGVVRAVEQGEADLGILPIENNNAGTVDEVRQLLAASTLKMLAEHRLPIRIQLLGLPGPALTASARPSATRWR